MDDFFLILCFNSIITIERQRTKIYISIKIILRLHFQTWNAWRRSQHDRRYGTYAGNRMQQNLIDLD